MNTSMALFTVIFVVTLILGVPIVWSMALASIIACQFIPGVSLSFLAQKMEAGSEKYALLAIFFFILAGAIMQHGGIASRLIRFAKALTGSVRGGLSIVCIVVCMFFAALSGSSVATTAAIGAIMYPELIKDGYEPGYAAALPVVGGTLGIVIPPSITFVVYGTTTNTSVAKLLMSGILPGVFAGLAMCVYCYIYARRHSLNRNGRFSGKALWDSFRDAMWALFMPIIVLGGIYAGIFTPTESAAVACIYGLLVSCVIYRKLKLKQLVRIAIDSVKSTSMIMLVMMAAGLFSYVLTRNNIPVIMSNAITNVITTKTGFLLAMNLVLLLLGMLMDAGAIVLIVAPILYPVAMSYGIDPVQLGAIIVFNLSVGQATPPFGLCLFAAQPITGQSIGSLSRNSLPFVILLYIMVLLTSFIPWISLAIPNGLLG